MTGHFEKTADENVWRLVGVDEKTGENSWTGLMMVDVDDLLVSAEEDTAKAALGAIASVWATSEVEKVEEGGNGSWGRRFLILTEDVCKRDVAALGDQQHRGSPSLPSW